jgi:tRNA-2-methylthio-N6-dimethylallyladenosine synthase
MSKKLFIETLGCAMNVRDSEHIMAELSKKEDYSITTDFKDADLIIINTCSVREKPVQKLFSEIGQFSKKKKPSAKIGVCGCTASHLGAEIIKRAPVVDFVLGARNVSKITEVIDKKGAVEVDIDYDESTFAFSEFRGSMHKAMVNISIGCNKQCSFCIVPKTRGDEISIPPELIVNEARKAAQNGAKEIFLLGQNVNNYGRKFSSGRKSMEFSDLLEMVSEIDEVERIRFTSPHPLHMDDKFLKHFASNPKICKSMHMPLQSGSTHILKEMKRGYSKEWFLDRVQRLKDLVPDVRISTDVIIAFPGESEKDFEDTLDVLNQVRFDQMFSFKYSPRPLTPAADLVQVDPEVASRRLKILQDRHTEILDEIVLEQQNKVFDVYFEELRRDGGVAGRSDNGFMIEVKGSEELLGKTLPVKITNPRRMVLYGNLA